MKLEKQGIIKQTQTQLKLWKQEIEKYTLTLTELTNQLNEIKLQIKNKK